MYGEAGNVIGVLGELKLPFVVAIRSNHGVLLRVSACDTTVGAPTSRVYLIVNQKDAIFVRLSLGSGEPFVIKLQKVIRKILEKILGLL